MDFWRPAWSEKKRILEILLQRQEREMRTTLCEIFQLTGLTSEAEANDSPKESHFLQHSSFVYR